MKLVFNSGNPNLGHILVKLSMTDNCIALRTYDRIHGGHGRFLIILDRFRAWLQALPQIEDEAMRETVKLFHDGTFYDMDCGHILTAYRNGENVSFNVTWLSSYGNGDVYGFKQSFDVPINKLWNLLDEHINIRLLHAENGRSALVSCTSYAMESIRNIRIDKRKRHAFSKAMRDCFKWHGDTITLSRDGSNDFYFSAEGGWAINGGLILHNGIAKTPSGEYPKLYYSVHT